MRQKHSSFCLRSWVVTAGPGRRERMRRKRSRGLLAQPRIRGGAGRPHPPPGSLVPGDAGLLPVKFWGLAQPASSVRVKAADRRSSLFFEASMSHGPSAGNAPPRLPTRSPGQQRLTGQRAVGRGSACPLRQICWPALWKKRRKSTTSRWGSRMHPSGLPSSNHEDPKRAPAQSPMNVSTLTLRMARPAVPSQWLEHGLAAPGTRELGRAMREPHEARTGRGLGEGARGTTFGWAAGVHSLPSRLSQQQGSGLITP